MAMMSMSGGKTMFDIPDMHISVQTVEIVDSQLMDQILLVTESDSVLHLIQKYFCSWFDFKEFGQNKTKIEIFIHKRHFFKRGSRDTIFRNLITEELRDIIDTDTLIHVVLSTSEQTLLDYETIYKGRHFYFFDTFNIDHKPIFRLTNKRRIAIIDSKKLLKRLNCDMVIPFIYYNNRLYVEPDSLQWLIVSE